MTGSKAPEGPNASTLPDWFGSGIPSPIAEPVFYEGGPARGDLFSTLVFGSPLIGLPFRRSGPSFSGPSGCVIGSPSPAGSP